MKPPRLRSRVTYANLTSTLALALALSTGGAYAVATIGAADIKDNAIKSRHITDSNVKTADLQDGAVTSDKLADAQTQVIDYRLGGRDFAVHEDACVDLSGLTRTQITNSVWTAQLNDKFNSGLTPLDDIVYSVPGSGELGASQYRVFVQVGQFDVACVARQSGPGEAYDSVRIIRTIPTEVVTSTP